MSKVGVDDYIVSRQAGAGALEALPRVEIWPTLPPEALYGLVGRTVETITPYTEADPVATLAHVLAGFGNLIGRGPHARVEHTVHPCNGFFALVGQTSKGRKGQAWSTPRAMLRQVDEAWAARRVRSGLSSGEGLIYHVRDAREEQQPVKERGRVLEYQTVVVDPGEDDKRLLVIEPELASVLRRMNGETNSLSAVLRQAWDDGDLSTLTKSSPLRATGAHISIIAHVTREELVANLTETERANGFANRFIFLLARRSKCLPEGAEVPEGLLRPLIDELLDVAAWARTFRRISRDEVARAVWADIYPTLSAGEPGLLGAILARAEAHVLRLSVLYAVMDKSPVVRVEHLKAAVALWEYSQACARQIFGDRLGLSVADTIIAALQRSGPLTRTEISGLFSRNKEAAGIDAALSLLHEAGKARRAATPRRDGAGRPAETWEAVCAG